MGCIVHLVVRYSTAMFGYSVSTGIQCPQLDTVRYRVSTVSRSSVLGGATGRRGRRRTCVRRGSSQLQDRLPGASTHDLKAGLHHLSLREAYGTTLSSLGPSLAKSTFGRRRSEAAAGRSSHDFGAVKTGSPSPFEEVEVSMWCRITCRTVLYRFYTA